MASFIEWTVAVSGGSSVSATTTSSPITGWVEGFKIVSSGSVDAGMTGTLSEVGGLEDDLWSGTIGNDATIRKYPVHEETNTDDSDPGTKGKFYLNQQPLQLTLASAGGSEVSDAATIIVKYIPDRT